MGSVLNGDYNYNPHSSREDFNYGIKAIGPRTCQKGNQDTNSLLITEKVLFVSIYFVCRAIPNAELLELIKIKIAKLFELLEYWKRQVSLQKCVFPEKAYFKAPQLFFKVRLKLLFYCRLRHFYQICLVFHLFLSHSNYRCVWLYLYI